MWTKIKNFLLDILFPVYCIGCNKEKFFICPKCIDKIPLKKLLPPDKHKNTNIDNIIIAADYHHPLVKKAIHAFKYPPYSYCLSKDLTQLLIKQIKITPESIYYLIKNNFILIPIPIYKNKLAFRGFNQAEHIAKELNQKFHWPINTKILKKIKSNQSQTSLTYEQRKINVKDVFSVLNTRCPKNIILVDDVVTSGATLEQASKILRLAGAQKIWALVLAK